MKTKSIQPLLQTIDELIKAHYPNAYSNLQMPKPDDLQQYAKAQELSIPSDLTELWSWKNGDKETVEELQWYSIERAFEERSYFLEDSDQFDEHWIPFMIHRFEAVYCYDLNTGKIVAFNSKLLLVIRTVSQSLYDYLNDVILDLLKTGYYLDGPEQETNEQVLKRIENKLSHGDTYTPINALRHARRQLETNIVLSMAIVLFIEQRAKAIMSENNKNEPDDQPIYMDAVYHTKALCHFVNREPKEAFLCLENCTRPISDDFWSHASAICLKTKQYKAATKIFNDWADAIAEEDSDSRMAKFLEINFKAMCCEQIARPKTYSAELIKELQESVEESKKEFEEYTGTSAYYEYEYLLARLLLLSFEYRFGDLEKKKVAREEILPFTNKFLILQELFEIGFEHDDSTK